jgi:hypothetical protein
MKQKQPARNVGLAWKAQQMAGPVVVKRRRPIAKKPAKRSPPGLTWKAKLAPAPVPTVVIESSVLSENRVRQLQEIASGMW